MFIHKIMTALIFLISVPAFAIKTNDLAAFVNQTCQDSVVANHLFIPRFDLTSSRTVALVESPYDGKLKLRVRNPNGKIEVHLLPKMRADGVLAIGDSIWLLTQNSLVEFSLKEKKIIGRYPTFPKPFEPSQITRARGFAYHSGRIYIAHGELGVSVFDLTKKAPTYVLQAGLQPASMIGAVALKGHTLFVLQGAYHPSGFNGLSIYDLKTGNTKLIKYPLASGVVDPYKSTMKVSEDRLIINNGGWIHTYELSALATASGELAPRWIPIAETLPTAGGNVQKYLMINGDLLVNAQNLLACSSVHFVPVGEHKPIREARMIHYSFE